MQLVWNRRSIWHLWVVIVEVLLLTLQMSLIKYRIRFDECQCHPTNCHVFVFIILASHRRPIFKWMHLGAGTLAQIIAGKGDFFHSVGDSNKDVKTDGCHLLTDVSLCVQSLPSSWASNSRPCFCQHHGPPGSWLGLWSGGFWQTWFSSSTVDAIFHQVSFSDASECLFFFLFS